jgi:Bacterial EndoU nuclease
MRTVLRDIGILLCGLVSCSALLARQAAAHPFPPWLTRLSDDMRRPGASIGALDLDRAAPARDPRDAGAFRGGRLPARATVDAARRRHILEGDATGGGHRPGTGIKGKSEFPAGWSDDKIIREVESVANDPTSTRTVQPNGRIRVEGLRGGVGIRVIVAADGTTIVTAHPINTPRNP